MVDPVGTGGAGGGGYRPPPAFAPPQLRVAPLNEAEVLGASSYPPHLRPLPPVATAVGSAAHSAAVAQRAHRRTVGVLAVVASALIAIGVVLINDNSTPVHHPRTVMLPAAAGGLTRLSTMSGTELGGLLGGTGVGGLDTADLATAKVGVYGRTADLHPSALFIGVSADESPDIGDQLRHDAAGSVADQVLRGAGATGTVIRLDAGGLGGALECAAVEMGGSTGAVGVWTDEDTLGLVLLVPDTGTPSPRAAGSLARQFRAAAER